MLTFSNSNTTNSLVQDTKRATKVLLQFIKPDPANGQYPMIPPHILKTARGLVVISLLEAGFFLSGRAGSGIIIAKLPNGSWSAPVAIGLTRGGANAGQMGFEKTDLVFVLNNQDSVDNFIQFGNISFNNKITLSMGPVTIRSSYDSRNVSQNHPPCIYLYSKSKGIFAGFSAGNSKIVERVEENRKVYGHNIRITDILSGRVTPPYGSEKLYKLLNCRAFDFTDFDATYDDDLFESDKITLRDNNRKNYDQRKHLSINAYLSENNSNDHLSRGDKMRSSSFGTLDDTFFKDPNNRNFKSKTVMPSHGRSNIGESSPTVRQNYLSPNSAGFRQHRKNLSDTNFVQYSHIDDNTTKEDYVPRKSQQEQVIALYDFNGIEEDDLKFKKGDLLNVISKTKSSFDWWTGELQGKKGLFPANYVKPFNADQ